jgi:hypothetical protein
MMSDKEELGRERAERLEDMFGQVGNKAWEVARYQWQKGWKIYEGTSLDDAKKVVKGLEKIIDELCGIVKHGNNILEHR